MENISDRIRTTIEKQVDSKGRPQKLEQMTGILSETWRKFLSGKQRATLGMLEAVSKEWPQYSFWLNTGIPDEKFGHHSPVHYPPMRIDESKTTISSLYLKARLEPMLHEDELVRLNKDLAILEKIDLRPPKDGQGSNWKSGSYNKLDMLEKLRFIDIFLENYILELDIEIAIETFNFMRIKMNSIINSAPFEDNDEVKTLLLTKFKNIKDQLETKSEERTAWILESQKNRQWGKNDN